MKDTASPVATRPPQRAHADAVGAPHPPDGIYQALFVSHPHPMWVQDPATLRILDVNDAAIRSYGWSRAEFLQLTSADLVAVEESVVSPLAGAGVSPGRQAALCRHRRCDGTLIDVELTTRPMAFGGSDAEVVLALDVTQQVLAESALRDSEAFPRRIMAGAPLPMMVHADDGSILEINDALVRLVGRSRDELPTVQAWVSLMAVPQSKQALDDRLALLRRGALASSEGEYDVQLPGGDLRRWLIATTALGEDRRHRKVFVSMASDVTARHRAEQAIAESERLVRSTLDSLAQHIAIVNADGTIVAVNEAWCRFARENGADPDRVGVGANYLAACVGAGDTDDEAAAVCASAIRAVLAGQNDRLVFRYECHAPDTQRWFECAVTRFRGAGPAQVVITHENVTARIKATQLLAASEARFRVIFEQAAIGISLVTPDGHILQVNDRVCEILGYTRDELLRLRLADLAHPDDTREDEALQARLLRGEIPSYQLEKRYRTKSGARVWLNVSASLLRDADAEPTYLLRTAEDISARKAAEQALRESEERLRLALEAAQQGTYDLDVQSGQCIVSPEYATMLGYDPSTFTETNAAWIARLHDEDRDRVAQHYRDYVAGHVAEYAVEFRQRTRGGTWKWILSRGRIVGRDASGAPVRMSGTHTDIDDRKAMEERLVLLSLAVEQCLDAIVITDVNACIEYVNQAFTRVSGYSRQELIGRNPRILNCGRTQPEIYRALWESLVRGDTWRGEFHNCRKDGTEYLESVVISPVRQPGGRVSHYLGVKTDITERRRNENELADYRARLEALVEERTAQLAEVSRRAEEASKAKGRFLANMSHEIRTPMNGVLGTLELLEHTPLDQRQVELVGTIRDSGIALLVIIDDILDFSKIEANRLVLAPAPLEVGELVESVCELLANGTARRSVTIDAFVDPGLPAFVLGDAVRLRQILYNLVGNAIKFSGAAAGRQGHVRVAVRRCDTGAERIVFVVEDNGIGMGRATLEHLFEPFTQGESATNRRFGGTGLGLVIVRRLIDLMGGVIDVRSAPDQGSAFTVTVPLAPIAACPVDPVPDLAGIWCVALPGLPFDLGDVCTYLEHAGARFGAVSEVADQSSLLILRPDLPARPSISPPDSMLAQAATVVLTRDPAVAQRARDAGVTAIADAVLRRGALLHAAAIATGRVRPSIHRPQRLATPNAGAPRHILVAEDDEVNRKVIAQQLALLGYNATVVANGLEALHRLDLVAYDLLLTDLHMPHADGYDLVRALRDAERRRPAPSPRLPVVALTANAVRGEADRAIAAGMDAYLTKPVTLADLRDTIERFVAAGSPAPAATPSRSEAAPAPMQYLDLSALAALVGDDPAVIRDIVADFRTHALPAITALRDACQFQDAARAKGLAHQLKSSSRSIGAGVFGDLCEAIERAARAGRPTALAAFPARIDHESSRLVAALDAACRERA